LSERATANIQPENNRLPPPVICTNAPDSGGRPGARVSQVRTAILNSRNVTLSPGFSARIWL